MSPGVKGSDCGKEGDFEDIACSNGERGSVSECRNAGRVPDDCERLGAGYSCDN